LATIVTLELLQQKSDHSNGLLAIMSRESGQFLVTVIPAAALTGLTLLYSSIYFNIALLAPYHHFARESGTTAKRSITSDYLGNIPLFALAPAVHQGHVATCASAFAAVVAAFLTIVVSGLYTVQPHSFATATTVQRNDTWNVTWPLAESDGSAAQALQFITWEKSL
jgi:preprotein translocase subunit SecG